MKDLEQMQDNELMMYGIDLMLKSVRVIFDKDAPEHKDYDSLIIELKKRRLIQKSPPPETTGNQTAC